MRGKITVVPEGSDLVGVLSEGDYADVVGPDRLPGSDVVVVAPGADVEAVARRAASRAPGAVIVLASGDDVRAALDASLLPRGRVIAVPPERVREAVEAILFDSCRDVAVTLVGLNDQVGTHTVVLGAGGVRELRD
jgi:hypothetical protein